MGCKIHNLTPDGRYPDGCFVEDRCFAFKNLAVICPSSIEDRKGEGIEIRRVISGFKEVKEIVYPGVADGGDIIEIEGDIFARISKRTNLEGVKQLSNILGKQVAILDIPQKILHLKSVTTNIGKEVILVREDISYIWKDTRYNIIPVSKKEAIAANCIAIGNQVMVPAGCQEAMKKIEQHGFSTIGVEITEFEKGDGSLTCLAVLFEA
jgi:dimethylargininase